jgi:chromosome segregation ATPase
MGHTTALGVDLHYFSRDVEFHRKVFVEKAMSFLMIETAQLTSLETVVELKNQLKAKDSELQALKEKETELSQKIDKISENMVFINENLKGQIDIQKYITDQIQAATQKMEEQRKQKETESDIDKAERLERELQTVREKLKNQKQA